MDAKEIKEIAHKAVLKEIDQQIQKLTHTETVNEQVLNKCTAMQQSIEELKDAVKEANKQLPLKKQVLELLKAKLETT